MHHQLRANAPPTPQGGAEYIKAMMRRKAMGILIVAVVYASMVSSVLPGTTKAPPISTITLLRTPREGIQPQTVLDRKGVLHMIYFKGNASAETSNTFGVTLTGTTFPSRFV